MNKKTIIVVGAGMSGIMATRILHEAGHHVICLEARERIGGRTHTDHSLGISVDLGASWIHGPIGNPMTPLAKQFGIRYGETDFVNRSRRVVQAYDADGTPLAMDEYTEGQLWAKASFTKSHASLLHHLPQNTRSLKEMANHGFWQPPQMTKAQRHGFHYWSVIRSEYSNAADWDQIDWQLGSVYATLPGDDLLVYGGGYNGITDRLADGLDVRTNVRVTQIAHHTSGVRVSTSARDLVSDYVIVTVPLGVLKANAISFAPALPQEKQDAIKRIGFGNYEKLAMRFDKFYWPHNKQRLNFLSQAKPNEPPLFHAWLNLGYYTNEPVIVAYHAGRRAQHTNQWDDDEMLARTLEVMQHIFGNNGFGNIPAPLAYVRSGWEADEFSRGSYSFDQIGQQPTDRHTLAQSVGERLFFAGEATHPYFYATVHGAYETGVWTAQQVMAMMARLSHGVKTHG